MRRKVLGIALSLATLVLTACTPFLYGGIVVLGPAKDEPVAQGAAE